MVALVIENFHEKRHPVSAGRFNTFNFRNEDRDKMFILYNIIHEYVHVIFKGKFLVNSAIEFHLLEIQIN